MGFLIDLFKRFRVLFDFVIFILKPDFEDAKKDVQGKQATDPKPRDTAMSINQDFCKKLWWVEDLELLYNGDKYALEYTGDKRQTTDYVYDDVALLNRYQARLAQKQADGSILYGIAGAYGSTFFLTNCEYTKVTFLDGDDAVLAIDKDGNRYAIDYEGNSYTTKAYWDLLWDKYIDNND